MLDRSFRIPAFVTGMMLALSMLMMLAALLVGCSGGQRARSQLTVTSFSPKESSNAFEPIRIHFDRPAVSEEQVGKALGVAPVEVLPPLKVAAHWLDRQTLVVKPLSRLAGSTRYEVRLKGKLAARVDRQRFAFLHRPVRVEGPPPATCSALAPRPRIILSFNQPVRATQVVGSCSLTHLVSGKRVALVTPHAVEATRVELSPKTPLDQGTTYSLRCAGIQGVGGNAAMPQPFEQELSTYPALAVKRVGPNGASVAADDVRISVALSTPVTLDQARKHIVLWPAARGFKGGYLDSTGTRYTATVNLRVSTRYAIRVGKGLTDIHGQTLGRDALHRFTTGDASPQLSLESGIFAVEPSRSGYPVWSRNVRRFRMECAAVPKDKVVKVLTSGMDYDPWYDASYGKKGIEWGRLGLRRRVTRIDAAKRVGKVKNKWILHELRLSELCGGERHQGLYLAQLSSREVERGLDERIRQDYYSFRYPFRVLANVTRLGVLVKAGTASGLVWVTGIDDAKPVASAKVAVYSPRGKLVHSSTTDARGIAQLPGTAELLGQPGAAEDDFESWRAQRLIVVVEHGPDMAVVDGNWQNGIQIWNFGVPTDRTGGAKRIRGFIQSDRGIYRPGETVHFKGLVREIAVGQAPHVPAEARIHVLVKDSRGATLFRRRLRLTAFGGFSFDLPLGKETSLGDYTVTATIRKQSFVERFQVEEFRKVSYELKLKGARRHERLGRRYTFTLDARYLFGAPVASASVHWNVQRRRHLLHFPAFPEYAFADYAAEGRYWYWEDDRDSYPTFVSDGEGQTDEKGRLRFAFRDPDRKVQTPQDYLVQVVATDETDQSVSKRTVVAAHKSDFYVGLHGQEWVQAVDMPFAVNTVAVSPEGKQVSTEATLSYVRERYTCASRGVGYRAVESCKPRHETVWSRRVQIPASGSGTERIMPKQPGEYIVRLEATDPHGNRVAASRYVWVIGKGEAFWSGDESARMALVPSKAEYNPGETARMVARGALSGSTALVTLERDGIIEARVVNIDSSGEGIEIPLLARHAPNVFASVAMVRGRTGKGDRNRPQFKMGVANLQVSPKRNRLAVVLSTERETYEPGMPVSGKITVTDAEGKPVRAELSLSVADEGVLQLIAYKTPDPMKSFYAPWGLGIDSSTNWNRVARLNDPQDIEGAEEGGDSGAARSRVRSRFVSSAFWAPALATNAHGEVQFRFKAPDNLTAFRLMAVAADTGSRFGSGERRITIRKPLLAKPVLPRFLSAGDHAEVGVMVHNYTGQAGVATVSASASGVRLGHRNRRLSLPKDGAGRARFPVTVGFARRATFTFTVKMGNHGDAMRVGLPVNRPMVVEKRTLARGEVGGGAANKAVVALQWPAGVLRSDSRLEVTVDRTGLGELRESLRYLVQYPYGCLEQTLSRFIPMTKVKDLAASLELRELQGPQLQGFIRAGVAKVIRHQHANGHFSLWPSSETYPHLTAYALYGLDEARRAGVSVSPAAFERGARALRSWANGSGRTLAPGGESATLAMAAYILARLGKPDSGLNARLFEARKALPRYGKAFLLRALKLAGAPRDQQQTLLDELLSGLSGGGSVALIREERHDNFFMGSDVRTTAMVLSALLEVEPTSPNISRLAEGLKRARRPSGSWYNTQDNLYALVALADFARQRSSGSSRVTLRLGGRRLARARLEGGRILAFSRPLSRLAPGELTLESRGRSLYTVRLVLARRDEMERAMDRGLRVERSYVDLQSGLPLKRGWVKVGQLVRVELTVQTDKERHYVALVDRLPAGFEAVNERLATSVRTGRRQSGTGHRWHPPGYRPAGWTHQELRDDRALAFADRLPAGRHLYEYVVRATIPGRFVAAPAMAEAMYEPDVNGRSALGRVEVGR